MGAGGYGKFLAVPGPDARFFPDPPAPQASAVFPQEQQLLQRRFCLLSAPWPIDAVHDRPFGFITFFAIGYIYRSNKMEIRLIKVLAVLGVLLGSLQAQAVSYDGTWTQNKSNAGVAWTPMRTHANHFCFLSKVEIEETDTSREWARCRAYRSSGADWILEARLGKSSDADARCSAICYNN
ncbi:hypothetical protein FKG94_19605 [Exilibacterium tricleocarpae]|uniref:Uncharacterized protein n=1 Tax=Exilibacterium tricleocarpae TaxID=2591008 RepID=A0A545T3R1_9GAMM|nr:hypothetical protein [Exilibacterium tricleocarpae]TQV71850.1 hypothetical protein FKG94_19605 [Exilibacterium tricleocarpae]